MKLQIRNPVCVVNADPAAFGVLLSTKAMLEIKMNVPSMQPFSWEETFMQLDRALHGGIDLAWHYAIDSYAGISIAVLSWWIAEHLARWNMRLPHVCEYHIELERLAR